MTTWTPHALASSARRYQRDLWRVVEAQRIASTMRLVASVEEQGVLESVLEASKPRLPDAAARLHYLLATPFRYRSAQGSRFRAPHDGGVWYGAEALRTALAEKSYWRLRFLLDSPGTPSLKPVPHTAFQSGVRTPKALDLCAAPLVRDRATWTHRTDYGATQALAADAAKAGVEVIRYESVRDADGGHCAAVLAPVVFARMRSRPKRLSTWFIAAGRDRVRCATAEVGADPLEFPASELLHGRHAAT